MRLRDRLAHVRTVATTQLARVSTATAAQLARVSTARDVALAPTLRGAARAIGERARARLHDAAVRWLGPSEHAAPATAPAAAPAPVTVRVVEPSEPPAERAVRHLGAAALTLCATGASQAEAFRQLRLALNRLEQGGLASVAPSLTASPTVTRLPRAA